MFGSSKLQKAPYYTYNYY